MKIKSLVPHWGGAGSLAGRAEDDPFHAMQRQMNRLFDDFTRGFAMPSPMVAPMVAGGTPTPAFDVSEGEEAITFKAELPGMEERDVEVTLSGDRLSVSGEKRSDREESKDQYHLVERSYGSFTRSFRLPFTPVPDAVAASFDKGVLTVTVPKPPEAVSQTKRIEIGRGA
jgi:HSP20 family protein